MTGYEARKQQVRTWLALGLIATGALTTACALLGIWQHSYDWGATAGVFGAIGFILIVAVAVTD